MFGAMSKYFSDLRAAALRSQMMDVLLDGRALVDSDAKRYICTLAKLARDWDKEFGQIKSSSIRSRRAARKKYMKIAKKSAVEDLGVSLGFALFAYHIEASYTPGDDAEDLFSTSSSLISSCLEDEHKMGPYAKP